MDGPRNIIPSGVAQSQKNTHGMYSLIRGYYPDAQNSQDTIHRPHETHKEGRPKFGCFGHRRRKYSQEQAWR